MIFLPGDRTHWPRTTVPCVENCSTDPCWILPGCVLVANALFIFWTWGETGAAACFVQLAQVRNVLLPLHQYTPFQLLQPKVMEQVTSLENQCLRCHLYLTMLYLYVSQRCTSGEGSSLSGSSLRGLVRSLLPNTERRSLAMIACWSTEQWFSMERIMGYGDACRKTNKKIKKIFC